MARWLTAIKLPRRLPATAPCRPNPQPPHDSRKGHPAWRTRDTEDTTEGMATQRISYRDYINSQEWKLRRADALRRSIKGYNWPSCEVCGRHGLSHKNSSSSLDFHDRQARVDGSNGLEVHHLHYRTLGEESPSDLIVLCTDVLYYDDYNARCEAAKRDGLPFPEFPEKVGCHERVHADPEYRAKVDRIAAARR